MDGNEGVSMNTIITREKCFFISLFIVILISLLFIFLFDFLSGLSFFLCYGAGSVGTHFLIRKGDPFPNVIQTFVKPKKENLGPKLRTVCSQCGVIDCKHHRSELNVYTSKPWMNLKIPKEVDEALEEILNLVIDRHIYSWYSSVSKEEDFVQEIRISLRFILSSLLRRALQVDLVKLITNDGGNTLLKHLDCYLQARKHAKNSEQVEEAFLYSLGDKLHPAMVSRHAELSYLRQLTENILPFLVPQKYLHCKSASSLVREIFCNSIFLPVMDIIADPDIVNQILILIFDKTPMAKLPKSKLPKVEFLSNFISSHDVNQRPVLFTDFQTILADQRLLYVFMQFLKDESALNILQFYLCVDGFNTRILNPDLKKEEIEALHLQAQEMYNTYFATHALDRINFDDEIVLDFKSIISGPAENITKLRTTTPLFRAYEHALGLLESTYCPMFLQSDRYFSLLCGDRWRSSKQKGSEKGSNKGNAGASTISKLGNKLKGVFSTHVDEGQFYEEEAGIDLAEAMFPEMPSALTGEVEVDVYTMEDDPRLKKLSAWRVFIPQVMMRMDSNCKYYHTFRIDVQRIDVRDEDNPDDLHWSVERRYNEFYVLEAKLTEFHGELSIQLPQKRSQQHKGLTFLESKRPDFERYLQTLLTLPALQGSELLCQFLKSPIPFTTSFLPDIKLGKMIKTVPMKLMKEKGQHLLPFLQAFVASTEAAKPKPNKDIWKDIYEPSSSTVEEKLLGGLYRNNIYSVDSNNVKDPECHVESVIDLKEIYDYIIYLAVEVVKVPGLLVQLLFTCDILFRKTLQAYVEWYLDMKLQEAFKPQRLAELLNLLRDVLFFDDDPPRTKRQKAERARAALKQVKDIFPGFWMTEKFEDSITLLFNILQCPLLNKQLSYILLDGLAIELFPELQEMFETRQRS